MNGKRIIACALLAAAACAPAAPALAETTARAPYAQTAAAACPSPQAQNVVISLNELTVAMQQIIVPANQINALSGPLLLIGQGQFPQVIIGLNSTTALANEAVGQITALKPLSGCDADAVGAAYRSFALVSQQAFNILIGKSGVLASAAQFVAPPMEAALRQVEAANDALAFALIDRLPENAAGAAVKADAASLDSTLSTAISAYSNAGS